MALFLELAHRVHRNRDRYGKRHAHVAAGIRENLRVDSHHLPGKIEQRAAGIAGIDRHIGLDERHVLLAAVITATHRADDAMGDGVIHAEWRADRDHPLSGLELGRVAKTDHGQIARLDLEQGNVRLFVGANDLGIELAPVGQAHGHLVRTIDDMIVGEDVTIRGDNETRAGRLALAARLRAARDRAEEPAEDFRHILLVGARHLRLGIALRCRARTHVDDGRCVLFNQHREVRQFRGERISGDQDHCHPDRRESHGKSLVRQMDHGFASSIGGGGMVFTSADAQKDPTPV